MLCFLVVLTTLVSFLFASLRYIELRFQQFPCVTREAPDECLQYFTAPTGTIRTFNWRDTANRAARQLANQDYYICFRTELVRQVL